MGLTGRELCANGAGSNGAGFWFALTVKHQHERSVAGALSAGVTRIVGFGGAPVPLVEGELEAIRAALASKLPIGPWPVWKRGERS